MPANVDSMMYVRDVPWHGEGFQQMDWPGTWDQAWSAACDGNPWDIEEVPVLDDDGKTRIDGWKRYRRNDNKFTLHIAPQTWTAISNAELGQIIEGIMAHTEAQLRYDTAGALNDGKTVFACILLGDDVTIPGDPSPLRRYLFVSNAHDGTASGKAGLTTVRVVCSNTQKAAEIDAKRTGHCYSFRHSKGWQSEEIRQNRIAEAGRVILAANQDADAVIGLARELSSIAVTDKQVGAFIGSYYEITPETSTRARQTLEHKQGLLDELLNGSDQPTMDGIQRTAWGLWNAVTEVNDHMLPSKTKTEQDSQRIAIQRTLLTPNTEKLRGLDLIRRLTQTSPTKVAITAPAQPARKTTATSAKGTAATPAATIAKPAGTTGPATKAPAKKASTRTRARKTAAASA